MYLPNEIVAVILDLLGRRDLKSARLVCKTWCSYASGFLFDEIYVAPNRVDIEVFNAVTQHPILSKCVRHLVYDGAEFMPHITKGSYVESLWDQTMSAMRRSSPHTPDEKINDWAFDVARKGSSVEEAFAKWKDHSLINDGYKRYQEHAYYQRRALQSGDFGESLVQGLSKLICLESVILDGSWPNSLLTSLCEYDHGTPLARRWNPFHCFPHEWTWHPDNYPAEDFRDGTHHYWIITTALVRARRHIDEFAIGRDYGPGIPPSVFQGNFPLRPYSLGLDIAALSGLKRLHLRLASTEDGSAPEFCDNIEGLPKLLGSMHSLRRLGLDLSSGNIVDPPILYRYDQVFPQSMTWNDLEEISLENLASSATDLLNLLLVQMPNLKRIRLGVMALTRCRWESVIECLRQFNQFTSFGVVHDYVLQYDEEDEFWYLDNEKTSDYILHGGRHPCLSYDQPASASEAYMLKIDTSLRDRLLKMKSARAHIAV